MPFSARSAHGFTVHTIPSQCEFPRFASPVLKFLSRCLNSFTAFRTTTVLPSGGISCTSTTGYCRRVGTKHSNCASDRSSLWRFCLGTADGPASSTSGSASTATLLSEVLPPAGSTGLWPNKPLCFLFSRQFRHEYATHRSGERRKLPVTSRIGQLLRFPRGN